MRRWLIEHLPGGRLNNQGETLTDPPLWVPCDLVGVKGTPHGLRIDFEGCEYNINEGWVGPTAPCYFKDVCTALTTLDLLRRLIPAGEFRIRNITTEETIDAGALDLTSILRPAITREDT